MDYSRLWPKNWQKPKQADNNEEDEPMTLDDDPAGDPPAEPTAEEIAARPVTQGMMDDFRSSLLAEVGGVVKQAMTPAEAPKSDDDDDDESLSDPGYQSRVATNLEARMVEEVKELYPDLPAKTLSALRERLLGIKSTPQLQAFYGQKYHFTFVREAVQLAMESGEYVPAKLLANRGFTAPTTTAQPPKPAAPKAMSAEVAEEAEQLKGVFSDEQLKRYAIQAEGRA